MNTTITSHVTKMLTVVTVCIGSVACTESTQLQEPPISEVVEASVFERKWTIVHSCNPGGHAHGEHLPENTEFELKPSGPDSFQLVRTQATDDDSERDLNVEGTVFAESNKDAPSAESTMNTLSIDNWSGGIRSNRKCQLPDQLNEDKAHKLAGKDVRFGTTNTHSVVIFPIKEESTDRMHLAIAIYENNGGAHGGISHAKDN